MYAFRLSPRSLVLGTLLTYPAPPIHLRVWCGSRAGSPGKLGTCTQGGFEDMDTWCHGCSGLLLASLVLGEKSGTKWQLEVSSRLPSSFQRPSAVLGTDVVLMQHSSLSYLRPVQGPHRWWCARRSKCLRHPLKFPSSTSTWVLSHNKMSKRIRW